MEKKEFSFSTKAIHAGQTPDKSTGAIMTPIYQTSTYIQNAPGDPIAGYEYSRTQNPTRTSLQDNLAALENGQYGICFASGCAALSATLHLLKSGDHVILGDDVYGGTFRIFDKVFANLGIQYTSVDMRDLASIKNNIKGNTKLIWLETPTNPILKTVDIQAIATLKQQSSQDMLLAVDNTFATPYLQNPLNLGADIVCHSSTKYIGGHSDVIGGALIVSDKDLADKLYFIQNSIGAVPSPLDCFLLLRSTKTLELRMQKHCENAAKIAEMLQNHTKVEKVIYPGLKSHPDHNIAKKQMRGFGGMISFEIKGNKQDAAEFCQKLKIFSLAESLGGVESLVEIPAIMTHASIPKEERAKLGISDGLIRLSVGIENFEDLSWDLNQGLDAIN